VRLDWLKTFLPLPGGAPSHDTFRRVFGLLDRNQFAAHLFRWTQALHEATGGKLIAIDGKTLRRTSATTSGLRALHLVTAWASENGLTPAQVACEEKSNEITAIPELLKLPDLKGCTVTIDAMGCQTAIAAQIVGQGAEYVLALKQNHPPLYAAVEGAFAVERAEAFANTPPGTVAYLRTAEKDHGRLEIRQHWVLRDPALLASPNPTQAWANLAGLGLIERQRHVAGTTTTECHYYLLSAPLPAADFAAAARSHWGIENRVHWVLDVTFREDACRVRAGHAARNLAVVRHLARNLLRQDASRKGSLVAKRFTAALDAADLATIIAQVAAPPPPVHR
jgi:predicted transposase YbfD/YdcC